MENRIISKFETHPFAECGFKDFIFSAQPDLCLFVMAEGDERFFGVHFLV